MKKQKLFFSIAIVLLLSSPVVFAQTSGYIENKNLVRSNEIFSSVEGYFSKSTGKSIDYFSFILVSPTWAQAYGGITYSPDSLWSFSIGVGFEQAKIPWRTAASVYFAQGKTSSFAVIEYGGSGYWYLFWLNHQVGNFGFGIHAERFKGIGFNVQYSIPKTPFVLLMTPVYDYEVDEFGIIARAKLIF